MKNTAKKWFALLLILALAFSLAACGSSNEKAPLQECYRLGLLKGPTGMGGVYIMEAAAEDNSGIDVTLAAAPTELTAMLISGEIDIAALPTNVASSLYAKTEGGIQVLALNTRGVLYILENGQEVENVSDLAGRTIYATGQGSNPEYVLNYILASNGLTVGEDVFIEWRDSDELSTLMAAGEIDLCMLPVPAATAVMIKNPQVRAAVDLTAEWDALENGSELIMGCVVARSAFIEEHPEQIAAFLTRYEESVTNATTQENAAALMFAHEIVGSEAIAAAAIPSANLCCITSADIQPAIEGYYQVLFDADPTSIGGAIPDADFYYLPAQ